MTFLFKREFTEHIRSSRAALLLALLAGLLATGGGPSITRAQLNSKIAGVNLNAVLATSLTVSAAPGLVNFALVPNGVANGSAAINITTNWTLQPGVTVRAWAYFSSAPSALSDGAGDNIPSANVSGSRNGGAFAPFTRPSPFAASSSLRIYALRIRANNKSGTRSDTLALRIDTTGLNLPPGTYTGVLHIQARAL